MVKTERIVELNIYTKAFELMATAKAMTELYEEKMKLVGKYVHATSRGHEAIQIALGMQLLPQDFVSPYYRDDALLLGLGLCPYDLMLQLLVKRDDPFSGGRIYYSHPSLRASDKPKMIFQSSATGMQAIPATGIAMGMQYKEKIGLDTGSSPIVVCSLGDASVTEGEVAEAFQMAALKQLPIIYLVQDNGWDISATVDEVRSQDAARYADGFVGLESRSIDGTDFGACYTTLEEIMKIVRTERRPFLVHARVPLLNHHTSGVRMEWYRDDLEAHRARDPYPKLQKELLEAGLSSEQIQEIEQRAKIRVAEDLDRAIHSKDPEPSDLYTHDFAPTPIVTEQGTRLPKGAEEKVMVDCGLFAVKSLLQNHKECLFYGQDVGARIGGVFREAATLADTFGSDRVFNTAIQEAFIIGSTVGMSAVGLKPIVEVQFADYIWPGLNQLFTEVSRSCYLSNGKWPVSMVLRVPTGAYGSGGPYHSSSVESVVCNIRGLKIVYPSNGADLYGLLRAAYYDPNPVVVFEHKGLYWSKIPGTDLAKSPLPSEDYCIPIGKAHILKPCKADKNSMCIISYGMGVHWAIEASEKIEAAIEIVDLRSLYPLDEELIYAVVRKHGKCLVITEEPVSNSFAQSIAARIQEHCFEALDAPVVTIGSADMPAIPLNQILEREMVLHSAKVAQAIQKLLDY